MSVIGFFAMYLGSCFVCKPWKLLSKPDTEEEKKEHLKRKKDFVFITGVWLIMAFFFTSIVRHYFLEDLGWPSAALFALNVFVLALFIAAIALWEKKK